MKANPEIINYLGASSTRRMALTNEDGTSIAWPMGESGADAKFLLATFDENGNVKVTNIQKGATDPDDISPWELVLFAGVAAADLGCHMPERVALLFSYVRQAISETLHPQ